MQVELNRLADNRKVVFDIDLNRPLDAEGGEGTIYKSTLQGKEYVIKPVELHSDTKKIYKTLSDRINTITDSGGLKTTIKERVLHSFIPYAQNFHVGKLFGYELISKIDVFAYSFVKGEKLSHFLSERSEMLTEERLDICIKLLDLLDFMQRDCGILHADIFEDNFIIDPYGNLFPIDSTSCGYFNWDQELKKEEPVYHARNRGKSGNWGLPEPVDFSNEKIPNQYTDRWFATRLIWRILTNQMHPYLFLKRIDTATIKSFIDIASETPGKAWPPYLTNYDYKYLNWSEFSKVEKYMVSEFGRSSKIAKLFYDYFITGYLTPKSRPGFKFVSQLLNEHRNA